MKGKLRSNTRLGVEAAHQREKVRSVLRNTALNSINLDSAVNYVMSHYIEVDIRRIIDGGDKKFIQQIVNEVAPQIENQKKLPKKQSWLGKKLGFGKKD